MKKIHFIIFASLFFANCSQSPTEKQEARLTLAIGSCNKQDGNQEYWTLVERKKPDAFIWLGDNVYADTEDSIILAGIYTQFKSSKNYKTFRDSVPRILGTWDDHDYGENDAGKHFKAKEVSRALFLDFLDLTNRDDLKNRDGVYHSHVIEYGEKSVKIILLDTRYNRDSLTRDLKRKAYVGGPGSVLGETQWKWLRKELITPSVDGFIIGSSIQVIPEEHRFEKWANFPNERTTFLDVISQVNKPVLLISGDRHMTELSKIKWKGKEITELTSSALNSGWKTHRPEANKHRIGEHYTSPNFGILELGTDSLRIFAYHAENDSLLYSYSLNWK